MITKRNQPGKWRHVARRTPSSANRGLYLMCNLPTFPVLLARHDRSVKPAMMAPIFVDSLAALIVPQGKKTHTESPRTQAQLSAHFASKLP